MTTVKTAKLEEALMNKSNQDLGNKVQSTEDQIKKQKKSEVATKKDEESEDEGFYSPQPPPDEEGDEWRQKMKKLWDKNLAAIKRKKLLQQYFTDSDEFDSDESDSDESKKMREETSVRKKCKKLRR
jgi:hypothetical protein